MRILMFASYIYNDAHKEFKRNKTGYGLFVPDIAISIGNYEDVMLDTFVPTRGFIIKTSTGKCVVNKHTIGEIIIKSIENPNSMIIKELFDKRAKIKDRIHNSYYALNYEIIKDTINKYKPDIVHVHGIYYPFIKACEELKCKYVVTVHALVGYLDTVDIWKKEEEREFLLEAYSHHIPVTVISSGMKKRIQRDYLDGCIADNIRIVLNGTNIQRKYNSSPSKIIQSKKIVTVIGTICDRKNQIQIIEAIKNLGKKFDGYELHLFGEDATNGLVERKAKEYGLHTKVIFHGFVDANIIDTFLDSSILNIVASKDEAFGISIIEAFVHGVPTLTFSDLDAVCDLFEPYAMYLCNSRDTEDFASAIWKALNINWDKEKIKQHSLKYSLDSMAKEYIGLYKDILNNDGNI